MFGGLRFPCEACTNASSGGRVRPKPAGNVPRGVAIVALLVVQSDNGEPHSAALVDDDVAESQGPFAIDDEGHDVVAGWKRKRQGPQR